MTRPSDFRLDKGGSLGRKPGGGGGSAHGYNPNRAMDGRFGSGPIKARPKVGRQMAAAEGSASAPHPHVLAARAAVNKAKASPTAKNVGEAKAAVAKAKASGGSKPAEDRTNASSPKKPKKSGSEELTAVGGPGKDRPVQVEHGVDRIRKAESSAPRSDKDLIDAIGNAGIRNEGGRLIGLTVEGQATVRHHFDGLAAKHGMPIKEQEEGMVLHSRSREDMGGADGLRHQNGKIELSWHTLGYLGYHAQDQAFDPKSVRPEGIEAYQAMMHETVHSHGPGLIWEHGNPNKWQLAEEMSTEMASRHITYQVHGLSPGQHEFSGYGDIMHEAVGHVMNVTGESRTGAHDALSKAALDFKRRSDTLHPDEALRHMADRAVAHADKALGNKPSKASREESVRTLHEAFRGLADEINRRYPWGR